MSFEDFLTGDGRNRIFRMWELRRPGDWTPLEIDEKYIDQSHYIDDECSYVQVREVYTLPNGDLMLGISHVFEWEDIFDRKPYIEYRRLSQIDLSWNPDDQNMERWV